MTFEQVLQLINQVKNKECLVIVDNESQMINIKKSMNSTVHRFETFSCENWGDLKWKSTIIHFFLMKHIKAITIDWRTKIIKFGNQQTVKKDTRICLHRKPPIATNRQIERAVNRLDGFSLELSENKYAVTNRLDPNIQGHGFDFNHKRALLKAQFEYIERMAATVDLPKQIVAKKKDLGDQAVDPTLLGLPDVLGNQMKPFKDDLDVEWVKATSLLNKKSCFLPSQYVQYLKPVKENRFVYDNSNGCAVGNSYQESAFYSILESIERDVFMRFWFQASPFPIYKINFNSSKKHQLKERYFEEKGYKLEFYLLNDKGPVPVIWCLLRAVANHASIYSITGLGCHVNVGSAIKAAFSEVYNCYLGYKNKNLIHTPLLTSLEKAEDHLLYFASKQAKEKLDEKTCNQQVIEENELLNRFPTCDEIDFEDFLLLLKDQTNYQDILIVDQTTVVTSQVNLVATKSFLLGALPLDFSSHSIRVSRIAPISTKQLEKNIHPLA